MEMQLTDDPMATFKNRLKHLELPEDLITEPKKRFSDVNQELFAVFNNLDYASLKSIRLSGVSLGQNACEWLASDVLVNCKNLEIVDFSDLFEARQPLEIQKSLNSLTSAISTFQINELNISNNILDTYGAKGI